MRILLFSLIFLSCARNESHPPPTTTPAPKTISNQEAKCQGLLSSQSDEAGNPKEILTSDLELIECAKSYPSETTINFKINETNSPSLHQALVMPQGMVAYYHLLTDENKAPYKEAIKEVAHLSSLFLAEEDLSYFFLAIRSLAQLSLMDKELNLSSSFAALILDIKESRLSAVKEKEEIYTAMFKGNPLYQGNKNTVDNPLYQGLITSDNPLFQGASDAHNNILSRDFIIPNPSLTSGDNQTLLEVIADMDQEELAVIKLGMEKLNNNIELLPEIEAALRTIIKSKSNVKNNFAKINYSDDLPASAESEDLSIKILEDRVIKGNDYLTLHLLGRCIKGESIDLEIRSYGSEESLSNRKILSLKPIFITEAFCDENGSLAAELKVSNKILLKDTVHALMRSRDVRVYTGGRKIEKIETNISSFFFEQQSKEAITVEVSNCLKDLPLVIVGSYQDENQRIVKEKIAEGKCSDELKGEIKFIPIENPVVQALRGDKDVKTGQSSGRRSWSLQIEQGDSAGSSFGVVVGINNTK